MLPTEKGSHDARTDNNQTDDESMNLEECAGAGENSAAGECWRPGLVFLVGALLLRLEINPAARVGNGNFDFGGYPVERAFQL